MAPPPLAGRRPRLVACLAARPEARQRGPGVPPRCAAASPTRLSSERTSPPPRPPSVFAARAALPRCGTRRTRNSIRRYSGDSSGMRERAFLPRTSGISSSLSPLFLTFPRGKRARGIRGRPLKNRLFTSLQVRVPVAPSTQRREVRALIRSPILRSDEVVTDEALGLATLRAAVAVSPLHPGCLLLPPALVQRRTR